MARKMKERPNPEETRQRLKDLICARQDYAEYLRSVANGRCGDDPLARDRLKMRCDETMLAWRAAHDAWRQASFLYPGKSSEYHIN